MSNTPDSNKLTVIVSMGFVEAVYTTIPLDIEVEVLDFDAAKQESPEAAAEMNAQLDGIIQTQKLIY